MNDSPVFIVDGDEEDKELIEDAWLESGFTNKLYFFNNAEDVIRELEGPALRLLALRPKRLERANHSLRESARRR